MNKEYQTGTNREHIFLTYRLDCKVGIANAQQREGRPTSLQSFWADVGEIFILLFYFRNFAISELLIKLLSSDNHRRWIWRLLFPIKYGTHIFVDQWTSTM